jgi:ABC-2 type transport system permease protein
MVLGGMVFPISIMPEPMQVLANILPLTHSVNAVRAFTIKGLGLEYGFVDMGYMLAFGAAMLALALVSFRFAKE